jgi:hypothetical protein
MAFVDQQLGLHVGVNNITCMLLSMIPTGLMPTRCHLFIVQKFGRVKRGAYLRDYGDRP